MTRLRRTVVLVVASLCIMFFSLAALAAAAPAAPIGQWTAVASLPESRASLGVVTHRRLALRSGRAKLSRQSHIERLARSDRG